MRHRLFVYGTLRKGMENDFYLKNARLIFPKAWCKGWLFDTREGYPGMIDGDGNVVGEVYEVTEHQLSLLDELEAYYGPGHPENEYRRVKRKIQTIQGALDAEVYLYIERERLIREGIRIVSGDWCQYVRNRRR